MKVILSGGGSGQKTEELDKLFASLVDKSKPLLYIPIAIDKFKHPYPSCLAFLKSTFDNFGISKYVMVTEKDLKSLSKKKVDEFGGIYIGGGNTAYLLKSLKDSSAWNFLKEAIEENIPVYGGSAGAIILAKTILPSMPSDGNFVGLEDLTGMNLLDNLDLWCHFKEENKEKILEFANKNNLKDLLLLTESTGIYLDESKIKIIGKLPALRLKNGKLSEVKVGSFL
jgi:dipeptidase E